MEDEDDAGNLCYFGFWS